MLQSPQFLYRFELGSTPTGNYAKPTPYEIASRLSFIYLQSMPDAALFAAADKGELATPAQIEAQARRLLADPKGGRLLDYFEQWLDIDTLPDIVRDGTVYPNLDPTLPALLAGRDARVRRRSPRRRRRAPSTRSSPRRTRSPTRRSPGTTASPGPPGRPTRRSTPRGARAC